MIERLQYPDFRRLKELARTLGENIEDALSGPIEMDYEELEELEHLLFTHVAPFTKPDSSILLVGVGHRSEEIPAAFTALQPSHIKVLEPGPRYPYARKKWKTFLQQPEAIDWKLYRDKATFHPTKIEDEEQTYDVVMAFNVDASLQDRESLGVLLSKSRDLIVITTVRQDSILWYGTFTETDYVHINLLLNRQESNIKKTEELDYNLMEGHIWVIQKTT